MVGTGLPAATTPDPKRRRARHNIPPVRPRSARPSRRPSRSSWSARPGPAARPGAPPNRRLTRQSCRRAGSRGSNTKQGAQLVQSRRSDAVDVGELVDGGEPAVGLAPRHDRGGGDRTHPGQGVQLLDGRSVQVEHLGLGGCLRLARGGRGIRRAPVPTGCRCRRSYRALSACPTAVPARPQSVHRRRADVPC